MSAGTGPSPRHVVIVGAGIVGASIAFHLVSQGVRVTVLERNRPGFGATRASFAWINARDKNPRNYHDLNRRSLEMWRRFVDQLRVESSVTWGGEFRWAATADGATAFERRVRDLQNWGYAIRLLSASDLRKLEPDVVTGTVAVASYTEIDGHVDTALVVAAALEAVEARSGCLRNGVAASGLEVREAGSQTTVDGVRLTDGEVVRGDAVVLANGVGATGLAASAGVTLPQTPTHGATVITSPVGPVFATACAMHTPRDLPGLMMNMRQLKDGSVMIHGGTHDGSVGDRSSEDAEGLLLAAAEYLPVLRSASVVEVRSALRPMPADGHPVLGFVKGVPNLYLAVTHSGVTLAPLIGELASLEIVDGATVDMLSPYRLERFH